MDGMPWKGLTDFQRQRCLFPVSARESCESRHYNKIKIYDKDDRPISLLGNARELRIVVQAAWAVLLRSYVLNNIVSFVLISRSKDSTCDVDENGPLENLRVPDQVFYYDIPDHTRFCDIRTASSRLCSGEECKTGAVNTALIFSQESFPATVQWNEPTNHSGETLTDESNMDTSEACFCVTILDPGAKKLINPLAV